MVTSEARIDLLLRENIFVKDGTRCCREHFNEIGHINDDDVKNIVELERNVKLGGADFINLVESFRRREASNSTLFIRFKDFDSFTDKMCTDHTGYSKEQLTIILSYLKTFKSSQ